MNKQQIISLLKCLGQNDPIPSDEWVRCCCPLAPWTHDSGKDSNPSFGITISPGKESVFNCFTCYTGDLYYLLQLLSKFKAQRPKYRIKEALQLVADEENNDICLDVGDWGQEKNTAPPDVPWPDMCLDLFQPAYQVPIALDYIHSRGITTDTAKRLDIRFDMGRMAVVFPIRNWDGVLCSMRGRRINPQNGAPKHHVYGSKENRNKYVWFGEDKIDLDSTVVLVESTFDLASVSQVTPNVLAPLTVGMKRLTVERIKWVSNIVTLFDNGQGGDKARGLIERWLPSTSIIHKYPAENVSDPNDMTTEQIRDLLEGCI